MVTEESGGIRVPITFIADPKVLRNLSEQLRTIIFQIEEFREASQSLNAERTKSKKLTATETRKLQKQAEAAKKLKISLKRVIAASKERGEVQRRANKEEALALVAARGRFLIERQTVSLEVAKLRAIKRVTKIENARLTSQAAIAEATRKGLVLTSEEIRKAGILDVVLKEQTIARENLEKQKRFKSNKDLRNVKAETEALRLQNIELDKQALVEAQRRLGIVDPRAGAKRSNDKFNKSLKTTESLGNRISFTFRRLFGILAAFTIARKLVEGFVGAIRTAIQFNAKLEEAELGLASLFLAAGRVTDAMGDTVIGARGLALATRVARDQIKLLRVDALATSATFEELLSAFQTAVAPGIQAGLGIDQIREFAVSISKAATALSVPQQQLAEEIRSVLQGTIRVRDTRIAVALGISNADIRRAKELGILADFLEDRFTAFAEAGIVAQKNFNVLFTNTRDALIQLSAFTGVGFFESLKQLLSDVKNEVILLNQETGELEFKSGAVEVAETFFLVLQGAVEQIRILQQNLSSTDLSTIGNALGQAFGSAFVALRVGIEIFVQALLLAATALTLIFETLQGVGEFFKDLVPAQTIRNVLTLVLAFKGILISLSAILAVTKTIAFIIPGIRVAVSLLASALLSVFTLLKGTRTVTAGLLAMEVALTGSAAASSRLAKTLLLIPALLFLIVAASTSVTAFFKQEESITQKLANLIKERVKLEEQLNKAKFRFTAGRIFDKLQKVQEEIDNTQKALDTLKLDPAKLAADASKTKKDLAEIFGDVLGFSAGALGDQIGVLFEALVGGSDAALNKTKSLEEIFKGLPAAITQGTQALTSQKAILEKLKDASLESARNFEASVEAFDAGGQVASQRLELAKAETEQELKTRELRAQRSVAEKAIEAALQKQESTKLALSRLDLAQQNAARKILGNKFVELELEKDIAKISKSISFDRGEAKKADKENRLSDRDNLLNNIKRDTAIIADIREDIKNNLSDLKASLSQSFGDDRETLERLVVLINDLVQAEEIEIGNKAQLLDIDKLRAQIATEIFNTANDRVRLIAIEEQRAAKDNIRNLEIQLDLEKELTRTQSFIGDPRAAELAQAKAKVREEEEVLRLLKRQGEAAVDISIANALITADDETQNDLIFQAILLQDELNLSIKVQQETIKQTIQLLEEAAIKSDSGFKGVVGGLKKSFNDFKNQALDTFGQTLEIMTATLDGFVSSAAASITSIFDPQNTQTAKQRFGQFLLQIANMIIAMLIRVALVRAALGLDFLFGGSGNNVASPIASDRSKQVKKGGLIKGGGAPGLAHLSDPKGLALGGEVLPGLSRAKGVDTAAIWAQPGEFMMRLSAVRKYGNDVMSAINSGLIDPTALRALSASRKLSRHMRGSKSPHFAHGGLIEQRPGTLASSVIQPAQTPGISFMIASEEQLDILLAGGDGALFRWFGDNADSIRALLA